MKLKWVTFAVFSLLASVANVANADVWQFNVLLNGAQETPPVATAGTGTATVLFNDVTGGMTVNGFFNGLTGNTSAAHVHGYAPIGTPAGVVFGLTINTGVTSGAFSGAGTIPAVRIADVMAGRTYINVHSTFAPGGEIRGQMINPVAAPEPGVAGLLGLVSAVGFVVLRRRK